MDTGLQIKILREHKNISRGTMADLLNMSLNTYIKIESGDRIPNLKELEKISEKLEVDPTLFFKKDGIFIS
ncbi:MAG TPA: XRE family transcriptional regulator, partial [Bacteroidetes bacterium]|nr:XRE family transcriptional regulator [Bacteroidota bacterium]